MLHLLLLVAATDAGASDPLEPLMKEVSNWGRWGAHDQRGALNLVTAETRKRGLALARDGLALSLAKPMPAEAGTGPQNDLATKIHGSQTHLDALNHMPYQGKLYNGFDPKDPQVPLAVTTDALMGRGVLVDVPLLKGAPAPLRAEDLDAWEKKTGLRIGPGDMVLVRTGRAIRKDGKQPIGVDPSCARWLRKRDILAIGTDVGLEVFPGPDGNKFPTHKLFLVGMGVYVLDGVELEQLSRVAQEKKRWEFFLSVQPLGIPRGTGSPVNHIAVF